MAAEKKYKSFWSFYPYYLTEHSDTKNRNLHFIGTGLLITILIVAIILQAERSLIEEQENDNEDNTFDKIAQQFSEKISSDLKTAETKIKSSVKSNGFLKPDEETGVFL